MKNITAEEKLVNCINRFFDNPNNAELRSIRIDLYRIDICQLPDISKNVRKQLLKDIRKLLKKRKNEGR